MLSLTTNPTQDPITLSLEFEDALAHLIGAEAALQEAQQDLSRYKAKLEHEKALLITQGIQGKNQEEREAHLKLALTDYLQEQLILEAEYSRTKLHAEIAKKKWDCLRYQLQIFAITKKDF